MSIKGKCQKCDNDATLSITILNNEELYCEEHFNESRAGFFESLDKE